MYGRLVLRLGYLSYVRTWYQVLCTKCACVCVCVCGVRALLGGGLGHGREVSGNPACLAAVQLYSAKRQCRDDPELDRLSPLHRALPTHMKLSRAFCAFFTRTSSQTCPDWLGLVPSWAAWGRHKHSSPGFVGFLREGACKPTWTGPGRLLV